jgi:hypothetical protein
MDNMELWGRLRMPPKEALKTIKAGRLKGMSDISPQWRYMAITEIFGPCGVGWKYEIEKLWTEFGSEDQKCAFALVNFYTTQDDGEWSAPIPGIGGSMLVAKESKGPHTSDEAYKMAVTDALSVAMKMIGVAADIYMGNMDGSKYRESALSPVYDKELLGNMLKSADKCTNLAAMKKWIADNKANADKLNDIDKAKLNSNIKQYLEIFEKEAKNG